MATDLTAIEALTEANDLGAFTRVHRESWRQWRSLAKISMRTARALAVQVQAERRSLSGDILARQLRLLVLVGAAGFCGLWPTSVSMRRGTVKSQRLRLP